MTSDLVGGMGCPHWHSPSDVVAIRFHCCGRTYPCLHCHEEAEDHPVTPWPTASGGDRAVEAVLCRSCGSWLGVGEYLGIYGRSPEDVNPPGSAVSEGTDRRNRVRTCPRTPVGPCCPRCAAPFNPGCALHAGVYFQV